MTKCPTYIELWPSDRRYVFRAQTPPLSWCFRYHHLHIVILVIASNKQHGRGTHQPGFKGPGYVQQMTRLRMGLRFGVDNFLVSMSFSIFFFFFLSLPNLATITRSGGPLNTKSMTRCRARIFNFSLAYMHVSNSLTWSSGVSNKLFTSGACTRPLIQAKRYNASFGALPVYL